MTSSSHVEPSRQPDTTWPADGLEWLGRCPLCGSPDRSVLHSRLTDRVFFCAPGEWTLHSCGNCQAAYLDPRPTTDTIGLAYSSYFTHHPVERPRSASLSAAKRWRRALANGYRNRRYGTKEQPENRAGAALAYLLPTRRALVDLEFRHLPHPWPGARVLDVGAGDGTFLQWAAAAGWQAFGVDPDPMAVAAAQSRGLQMSLGTLHDVRPVPPFDVITANHVIEHVHDPRGFLARARDLLKPRGTLWIDTPNLSSIGHRTFGPAWLGLDPPRHLVIFSERTLRGLLEGTGFRIVRQLPRPDVFGVTFGTSQRIAEGDRNPLAPGGYPLALRLRAYAAAWRARIDPRLSEFLTIVAVREA